MEDADELPLSCRKCRRITPKPVRWVQDNTFFACPFCGMAALIDQDEAMKQLIERRRASS